MAKPIVFISYSHDSAEHAERVRRLGASVSRDGCDCRLDVYKDTGEDWPAWMTRQLIEADLILCAVTETYGRRFRDQELPDVGLGVGWEAGLIRRLLYAKKLHNDRVFPVVFESSDRQHIPLELQGYDFFVLDGASGYESLLRKVHRRQLHAAPATGTPPVLATHTTDPLFARPGGDASPAPSSAGTPPQRIAPSRLLKLGVVDRFDELVGREDERRTLTEAWEADGTHILIFVAEGGVGKTSLVADWLMDFVNAGWEGVDTFLDWSFYSQGTRDQTAANSGLFFDAALRHFGQTDLAGSAASADVKAERLAESVAGGRTLLVLDGVEPLQHPTRAHSLEGRFKDTGLERLLKQLAQMPGAGGLCVVTTRVPVVDLNRFHGGTVREETLDHLSEKAAARLLHQAGARRAGEAGIAGDDEELLTAARELHGHALTVQLLGGYLKQAHGGDIRRRDRVDWKRAFDEQQEAHAWAVMEAYERWFEQHAETGPRQLAALRLLGLFDRPAGTDCLDALRGGEVIPGLTEPLAGLDDEDWNTTLTRLADEHRLISLLRSGGRIEQVDAHPLVREYFASQLRGGPLSGSSSLGSQSRPTSAWTEGHRRLYEHLCEKTERRPDTLEGLQPLYQAVAHGCQAGLHQQACDGVYSDRIMRGTGADGFYSWHKLGAISANLGAVACFFDRPWSRLSPGLSAAAQAWLSSQAGNYLLALGRLTEAVEPMRAALEMRIGQGHRQNAARSAGNLSELELTLGQVSAAIADAQSGVEDADRNEAAYEREKQRTKLADALHQAGRRDEAAYEREKQRTKLADALHQAGRRDEARQFFTEAENMRVGHQPDSLRLYSVLNFRHCDLLLSDTERAAWQRVLSPAGRIANPSESSWDSDLQTCPAASDEVTGRATRTLERAKRDDLGPLCIALDHLTLGRAALYRALCSRSKIANQESKIQTHVNVAVDGLREAGTMEYLPRGLLTRAWYRQLTGDASGAASDLNEAWEIAERSPMPLYQADILLTRARLFGTTKSLSGVEGRKEDGYPWGSPQEDLAEARRLIEEHGYHRRDGELEDAEAALGTVGERED